MMETLAGMMVFLFLISLVVAIVSIGIPFAKFGFGTVFFIGLLAFVAVGLNKNVR